MPAKAWHLFKLSYRRVTLLYDQWDKQGISYLGCLNREGKAQKKNQEVRRERWAAIKRVRFVVVTGE